MSVYKKADRNHVKGEKKDNDIQSKCVGVLQFRFTIKGLHHEQAGRWSNTNR